MSDEKQEIVIPERWESLYRSAKSMEAETVRLETEREHWASPAIVHDYLAASGHTRIIALINELTAATAERDEARIKNRGWLKESGRVGWIDKLRKQMVTLTSERDAAIELAREYREDNHMWDSEGTKYSSCNCDKCIRLFKLCPSIVADGEKDKSK